MHSEQAWKRDQLCCDNPKDKIDDGPEVIRSGIHDSFQIKCYFTIVGGQCFVDVAVWHLDRIKSC